MRASRSSTFGSKPNAGDCGVEADAVTPQVDFNYRGLKVTVFKNGEEHDIGTTVVVARHQFKHWITFLDYLSKRLNVLAPVHRIFTTDGLQIRQFEGLQNGGCYVAVSQGHFIPIKYGTAIMDRDREKEIYAKLAQGILSRNTNVANKSRWNSDPHWRPKHVSGLDSAESVDIYLKKCGYGSRTGLPFPLDGVKAFHPHHDMPYIPYSSSAPKTLALDPITKAGADSERAEQLEEPTNEGAPPREEDTERSTPESRARPIPQRPRYDPDFVDFDFFPHVIF